MSLKRCALFLGLAAVTASAQPAIAADLYGGSVKDSYAPMAAASGPSIYLRLDGSYAGYDTPKMVEDGIDDLLDTNIDNSWSIGGGIGRYFTNTIRADITYDHRFEADAQGTLDGGHPNRDGVRKFGLESDLVLLNAYYDFNRDGRINPYLGLGLGIVHHKTTAGIVDFECGCDGTIEEGSSTHVAGALMAGFTAKLRGGSQAVQGGIKDAPVVVESGRGLYLDVGYRFLYLGETATGAVISPTADPVSKDPTVEEIHAHEFRVGLRYDLR